MRTLILNSPIIRVCSHASVNTRRLDAELCLKHPYFWEPSRRLEFLRLVSDRFEKLRDTNPSILQKLESEAFVIVGEDWSSELDKDFVERAEKKRGSPYRKNLVRDLLRFIRNQVRVQPQIMSPSLSILLPLSDKSWV